MSRSTRSKVRNGNNLTELVGRSCLFSSNKIRWLFRGVNGRFVFTIRVFMMGDVNEALASFIISQLLFNGRNELR